MVGRKREIAELLDLYEDGSAQFVAVYGRRRVGKTFLIDETFKGKFAFKHTALSPEGEEGEVVSQQLDKFYGSLLKFGLGEGNNKPSNWFEAFDLLEELLEKKNDGSRQVVFIDELPWLDSKRSNFIKAFESFWNTYGCTNQRLLLIICGSANSWIENNLINNRGGLYGRVTYEIKLSPFTLGECEEFLKSRGLVWSRYEIATSYMILGGIPFYLGYLKKGMSLGENVDNIFFRKGAQLLIEFDRLFQSCFENADFVKRIVILLGKKKIGFKREEIVEKLHVGDGGNLTKALNSLIASDYVSKYVPFGIKSKVPYYRLSDPFCAFFLRFRYEKDQSENFWMSHLNSQEVVSWKGIAFENVCLNHIGQIKRALNVGGVASKESSWYFESENSHGQVDLVIQRSDNVVNLCEIKFYQSDFAVDLDCFKKINFRIEAIRPYVSKKSCINSTLITTFGLHKNEYSSVFQNVVVLDDLFL